MTDRLSINAALFPQQFKGLEKLYPELVPQGEMSGHLFPKFQSLTKREKETLKLILKGHTNNQIAGLRRVSVNTVRTHRNRIWKKLDIRHFKDCLDYRAFYGDLH